MEYLIHYHDMLSLKCESLILCKLLILFSKEKLGLGHIFSQFIHKFKIGIF